MTSFKQIHCEYVNGDDKKRQKFGFEEEPEVVDREEAPTSSSCEKKKKRKAALCLGPPQISISGQTQTSGSLFIHPKYSGRSQLGVDELKCGRAAG